MSNKKIGPIQFIKMFGLKGLKNVIVYQFQHHENQIHLKDVFHKFGLKGVCKFFLYRIRINLLRIISVILIIGLLLWGICDITSFLQKQMHDMQEPSSENVSSEVFSEEISSVIMESQLTGSNAILPEYQEKYQQNTDMIGWLTIPGTTVHDPVMQGKDNSYYLKRDFHQKSNEFGSLFIKSDLSMKDPPDNLIIYGHNMMYSDKMFGQLEKYKKESFYQEHKTFEFDTLYEKNTYEIVAVFLSEVLPVDDPSFKYYKQINFNTQQEFDYFYGNIKAMSLYDTGVEASDQDSFITLSTCVYHVENGRLAIVAKKVK